MPRMSTAEELEAATAEAREVIRQMHAATKDLKHTISEARRVLREELDGGISQVITRRVEAELAVLSGEVKEAAETSTAKIRSDLLRYAEMAGLGPEDVQIS